ncbi:MAG: DUF4337 domain-containing protein [Deltaproteobacteria bacterium]|nr:DUF4337 domain-containing protein [Deltaproteobacteria bacterium]
MYDLPRENWHRAAALTVILLALLAVLAAFKASGAALAGQAAQSQEARLWAEFQEKSLREEVLRLSRDLLVVEKLLEHKGARLQKFVADRLKEVEGELSRLDPERQKLLAGAGAAGKLHQTWSRHRQAFSRAALFLLVGLALAAAAVPLNKKLPWLVGAVLGAMGAFFLVNGFFLWF